jgi:hypothetical protein
VFSYCRFFWACSRARMEQARTADDERKVERLVVHRHQNGALLSAPQRCRKSESSRPLRAAHRRALLTFRREPNTRLDPVFGCQVLNTCLAPNQAVHELAKWNKKRPDPGRTV